MAMRFQSKEIAAIIIAMISLLSVSQAGAEVQTITATHTYTLGDNDSRNEARQLCFLEAKRKVLEKAGAYIQSQAEVENLKLTKDKISSYSAALLSTEIIKEDFESSNGQSVLTLVVKADVDMADVRKRLEAIAADKGLQDRLDSQQRQIHRLEEQIQQLNAQAAPPTESLEPQSLAGTMDILFMPEQSAGITTGCALGYRAIGQDPIYRNDFPFAITGNILFYIDNDRSNVALKLKIMVSDILEDHSTREGPPYFAYIQTAHGTTAKSLHAQFDSPDPNMRGFRHFIFRLDENAWKVYWDIVLGQPVTIGFNRVKDGPDILVPLDLRVISSTPTKTGITRLRSNQTLLRFNTCFADIANQLLKNLGPSKAGTGKARRYTTAELDELEREHLRKSKSPPAR